MLARPSMARGGALLPVAALLLCLAPAFGAEPPAKTAASATGRAPPSLRDTTRRLLAEARPLLGAAVAVHAPTGRVLVFEEYRRRGQVGHPLTQAITPAASVFKLVTAAALLERGHVAPARRVCIDGGERRVERRHLLPPPPAPTVSCRPFSEALGFSRNAVFAQLATEHLLRSELLETAERLGFNQRLPFDVPAVMGTLEVPYNDLAFARTAVGFRGSRLSVLGAAHLAYVIANRGEVRRMSLGEVPRVDPVETFALQRPTADRLRRMMEVTVHSGTSRETFTGPDGASYLGDIRAAGKTGTLKPDAHSATASWFVGFAPSRAPELVVAVMLDNAEVWRRKANDVARDLMRAYFHEHRGVSHPYEPDALSAGAGVARAAH